ncbi:MAG: response regulator transcription factor [Bacteroidia bacterium]
MKIIIVDDHPMVRDGLKTMLEIGCEDMNFKVWDTDNTDDAVEILKNEKMKVALVDYQLIDLDGALVTAALMEVNPKIAVLGISNYNEINHIQDMIMAGAKGYTLKNISSDALFNGIKILLNGGTFFSPEVAHLLANQYYKKLTQKSNKSKGPNFNTNPDQMDGNELADKLSKREIEILTCIANEMTNEEIANKLELSKRTVDNHRQNMLKKLNAKNSMGLVLAAIKIGLINMSSSKKSKSNS